MRSFVVGIRSGKLAANDLRLLVLRQSGAPLPLFSLDETDVAVSESEVHAGLRIAGLRCNSAFINRLRHPVMIEGGVQSADFDQYRTYAFMGQGKLALIISRMRFRARDPLSCIEELLIILERGGE